MNEAAEILFLNLKTWWKWKKIEGENEKKIIVSFIYLVTNIQAIRRILGT